MLHNEFCRFRFPGAGFATYQNDLVCGRVDHSAIGVVNCPVDVWFNVSAPIHKLVHLVVLKRKDVDNSTVQKIHRACVFLYVIFVSLRLRSVKIFLECEHGTVRD